MQSYVALFDTGLGESIRIFEEYSVSKYGDYLGNK